MQSEGLFEDHKPDQENNKPFRLLINVGQQFWYNFRSYVEVQTKQIEENQLIPESIKQDFIQQLNSPQSINKQKKQQRQFEQIIQDDQKQFQDKVGESVKLDYKKGDNVQRVAMIIRHKGQGFNMLPNQEYVEHQKKLEKEKERKRMVENQKKWFKQSQFIQTINSQHSKLMIDQFIKNINQVSQRNQKKYKIQEMHLNNHYNRNINLLEFEQNQQLNQSKVV